MPAHGLHNPRDKMTAETESVALTCGLALGLAIWTLKPRNKLPPPPPQSLPGTNNGGTDALLNSSGGSDAGAEKAASGGPPRFAASLENRSQWGRQFGSFFLLSLQNKITFDVKWREMQPDVHLDVHTPDGTLAAVWSLRTEPWSFILTHMASPLAGVLPSILMKPRHLPTSITI